MLYRPLIVLFALGLLFDGFAPISRADQANEPSSDSSEEFVARALRPFWQETIQREPLFFIQSDSQSRPTAALLFQPTEILSVESATRDAIYEAGKDYEFDKSANLLRLPESSRASFTTLETLYPLMTSDAPKYRRLQGDKTRGIFFDNSAGYHRLQTEVVYRCEPGQWNGPIPRFAGDVLSRTLKKLRAKLPIRLQLCGDSISAGYNASKFTKVCPGCPAYGELVALALEKHYGSHVHFTNHAVNGWTTNRALQHAIEEKLGEDKPDLVLLAFGMNDVLSRDATAFQKNIAGLMNTFRERFSEVEFVLVAPMLGNVEWGMPMEQFPLHREALQELCGKGVALADLTAIWQELLKHKSFYDLTGNGLNHPNDYGHLIYAQTVLSLLIDPSD